MLYIGIDLGTSAVKLLLMDGSGGIKKNSFKRISFVFPAPWMVRTKSGRLVRTIYERPERADCRM